MTAGAYDLLIIGAGINGAGLARDASGRGKSVALVDKGDLGGGTSAASTKLIHGGLRYLEFYEFGLVRHALAERDVILRIAPHIASPMPFVLPLTEEARPAWMIRAGLFLYDHLAKRESFPGSEKIDLRRDAAGRILEDRYTSAFRYWDGWVDDSRLVVLNCRDAADRGAEIIPRDGATTARFDGELWHVTLESGRELTARQLVNCGGPWAERVARDVMGRNDAPKLDLVQGAHIVVPRIPGHEQAYMLQQPDGRIIFVLPYADRFTMIGTTETRIDSPDASGITPEERAYLLAAATRFLESDLSEDDVVASFAGTRPLVLEEGKDARETSRGWKIRDHDGVPALTVIGGKLTTYRLLAEELMERLFPGTEPWTDTVPLPGGDIDRKPGETPPAAFQRWTRELAARHDMDVETLRPLAQRYGTRLEPMLAGGLGSDLGGLYEAEVRHMAECEWATTPEDILWRRTKAGIGASPELSSKVRHVLDEGYTAS